MKQCPKCRKQYVDETLNFCLEDGEWLVTDTSISDSPTAAIPQDKLPSEAPTLVPKRQDELRPISSGEYFAKIKQHKVGALVLLGLLALLVAGAAVGVYKSFGPTPIAVSPSAMEFKRLTSSGRVVGSAISPDGKYVAYAKLGPTEDHSIWIHQVSASTDLQIVPEEEGLRIGGIRFTPDSEHVFFVKTKANKGTIWRVPVIGGNTKKLPFEDVISNISISPDGKRIVFHQRLLDQPGQEIVIANIDGTERRVLRTSTPNESFNSAPIWSPDGRAIAMSVGYADEGFWVRMFEVSAEDGTMKPMSDWRWSGSQRVTIDWVHDGSGVVFTAAPNIGLNPQLWFLPRAGGDARPITREMSSYVTVTMSADSRTICATRVEETTNLWIADVDNIDDPRRITSGTERRDGIRGLEWSPDDTRIYYYSVASGEPHIWVMSPDGTGNRMVTSSALRNRDARVSPDGKYIVLESNIGKGNAIWRTDIDGGNPLQLSEGPFDYYPSISPDGKWVVFTRSPIERNRSVWKVSIDGGTPTLLSDEEAGAAEISPDGKYVLMPVLTEGFTIGPGLGFQRIVIIPFDGGSPTISLDLEKPGLVPIHWTPDSKAVAYVRSTGGVTNIWFHPISGGPPTQLTHFKDLKIRNFAWSRNGKKIAFSLGSTESDVVLFKDFRSGAAGS